MRIDPSQWVTSTHYLPDDIVVHEGVTYQSIADAISGADSEPSNGANWAFYWAALTPSWPDWLFDRLPSWVKLLDSVSGDPLKRFLSVFGRAMNLTQQDINDFPSIMDPEFMPSQYIVNLGNTLGLLLPHRPDDLTQRKLLENIVGVYQHKGTVNSLKFLAYRYLGIIIDITPIDVVNFTYGRTVVDWGTVALADQASTLAELDRLLALYGPAGWNGSAEIGRSQSTLNDTGYLNVSFEVSGT